MKKQMNLLLAVSLTTGLLGSALSPAASPASFAYGETTIESEWSKADATVTQTEYQSWLRTFREKDASDSAKITLTPGSSAKGLNFSWYAESTGTPAICISRKKNFSTSKTVTGTQIPISRFNGTHLYTAANHVSLKKYLRENTTYYYCYTDDINASPAKWSRVYTYHSGSRSSFSVILTGDSQIGASGNIAADTYNWNHTLQRALETEPYAAFLLSAGDQIDYKTDEDEYGLREAQYAGYLYPHALRSLPVAAAIGNHETKGTDYKYHFNNPNSSGNYGKTPSGCDYYFRRGNALFVVLNSNNRNITSHRRLLKQAVKANSDAKWRIVMFHHDIYGSGAYHSNRTSANTRILLAPLMDEFQIDLVFSGHDHSYARSYPMYNGTAITGEGCTLANPYGTVYICLGSSSGSKMYGLASPKQFYVAERSNNTLPTFSTLKVSKNTLKLQTWDENGYPYADTVRITKNKAKKDVLTPYVNAKKALKKAERSSRKTSSAPYRHLKNSIRQFRTLFKPTGKDKGALQVSNKFRKSTDPLSYYGYAAGTLNALPDGFSTLLDKTRIDEIKIRKTKLQAINKKLIRYTRSVRQS